MEMNYLLKQYGSEKVGCVPWEKIERQLKSYGMTLAVEMEEQALYRLGNTIDDSLTEKLHIAAETDATTCQIIPYVIIEDVSTGEYLLTRHMIPGSEYLDAYSLGIATHVLAGEDIVSAKARVVTKVAGISAEAVCLEDVSGFIMDRSSVLGRTHLGIVLRVEIVSKEHVRLQDDMLRHDWKTPVEMASLYKNGRFEEWSELVFESEILDTLQSSRVAYSMMEAAVRVTDGTCAMIAIHA